MEYARLLREIKTVGGNVYSIGETVLKRNIVCIERGEGIPVLIHGAIHAREHLTTDLVIYLARLRIPDGLKIYFVPMVNPDGVEIAVNGTENLPSGIKERVKSVTPDTRYFKANARCVDLNVNFDARWGRGVSNVTYENFENYIGPYPFSEPESVALRDFTNRVKPKVTISYHLAGEEIYWGFEDNYNYKEQIKRFADATGYALKTSVGSTGGYKDWYVKNFDGIGITVEVGRSSGYPYPETELDSIIEKNKNILNVVHDVLTEP